LVARTDRIIHQLSTPTGGTFIPPTVLRVDGIAEMPEEIFGPVLHVAIFDGVDFDTVIADINASGYGLTFGLHTRIASRVVKVSDAVHAGNIYFNRNQIGAVVGSQPFGGEGLSGTGPKAGGPHYLPRFTLGAPDLQTAPLPLPGPTGESNVLDVHPRGTLLCVGPSDADRTEQQRLAASLGCRAITGTVDTAQLSSGGGFDAVAWFGDHKVLRDIRVALSQRSGPLLPLLASPGDAGRLQLERQVCIDTTAAGGNASLMAQAG
ncbi:MAG: aldehyde dehydrogenase family protein, partial [Devosia sp.]